jgi:hypothetical protein
MICAKMAAITKDCNRIRAPNCTTIEKRLLHDIGEEFVKRIENKKTNANVIQVRIYVMKTKQSCLLLQCIRISDPTDTNPGIGAPRADAHYPALW